ncbi:MAG: GNAT family protein [Planctomycetota bacterium]|nr:GNAT family protein [Planctomycetota bacterium]MED6306772.1 GNAT family protein [Planctomycetota bacterium]
MDVRTRGPARPRMVMLDPGLVDEVADAIHRDPEGLWALAGSTTRDAGTIARGIRGSLRNGALLWRVEVGEDPCAGLVGEGSFDPRGGARLVVWLDPRHRGHDLGVGLVGEALRRLVSHGRTTVQARVPAGSYAALRILNRLEFTYLGISRTVPGRVRYEYRGA